MSGARAGTVSPRREGLARHAPERRRGRRRRRRGRPVRRARGRRARRARGARLALAAGPDRQLLGPGRDRRRAGRGRLARAARRGHARRRPRRGTAERRARALRGVPGARARAPDAGRALRRRSPRQPRARAGGRPLARAGSSTPAAPPPGAASRASCPPWPPPTSASRCWSRPPRWRSGRSTAAASGCSPAAGDGFELPRARAGHGAGHRRDGRPLGAHHQPARRRRRRARRWPRPPAPSSPTSSSSSSIPPRSRPTARATASSSPRPSAARAPSSSTPAGERFVDELAPRDQVALAIEAELARSGERFVGLDLRDVDMDALPEHRRRARRGRDRPGARPGAGRARGPLHDGRRGHRPRRPLLRSPAFRRRASAPAPACTAPTGWRPTRSPSASSTGGGPRSPRAAEPSLRAAPGPAPAPGPPSLPPESTRAALWRHAGLQRDAAGLDELAQDPFPLARLIAAACLAREESRGAHQRTDHPETDPALRRHAHARGRRRSSPASERWE